MKKIKFKNYFLLIVSIIFTIQVFALTAYYDGPNYQNKKISDYSIILLNQIKSEINDEFQQRESSLLECDSFGMTEGKLFSILANAYKQMTNGYVELFNSEISQYFISKINPQLKALNTKLKTKIDKLINLPFDIVTVENNNLFLEKLDYKQLIDIIKNLNKGAVSHFSQQSNNATIPTIFKIKLNLTFKIKIDSIREENYFFPPIQHFITDNGKEITSKIGNVSDSVYPKL